MRGDVQGVGFRWFVTREAGALGLTGWVANESDGSVVVVAEGASEALGRLEAALHQGPASAHVTAVDARRGTASGAFHRFGVRSSAHSGD